MSEKGELWCLHRISFDFVMSIKEEVIERISLMS